MKPPNKRERDRLATRAAILDATEALMAEEGYAAVSTRRVAQRAGLKSQLVHYHFRTMDELLREVLRRSDRRHFARHLQAVSGLDPLLALLQIDIGLEQIDVVAEFESAAKHRAALRDDLTQMWSRFRALYVTVIRKHFEDNGIDPGEFTPEVLTFLMVAVGHRLVSEARLGFTENHAEVIAFMKKLLHQLSRAPDADACH